MINLALPDDLVRACHAQAKARGVTLGRHAQVALKLGLDCLAAGALPGSWRLVPFDIGAKIGKLTVVGEMQRPAKGAAMRQFVRCTCGREKTVAVRDLRAGRANCACTGRAKALVNVDGIAMSYIYACKKHGIVRQSVRRRVKDYGETLQQAFDYFMERKEQR